MAGNRSANGERDSGERGDDSVRDKSCRDAMHQSLREEKRVERSAHDADHRSDTTVEQSILRGRQPPREDVSIQHCHHDDGDDGRDLR